MELALVIKVCTRMLWACSIHPPPRARLPPPDNPLGTHCAAAAKPRPLLRMGSAPECRKHLKEQEAASIGLFDVGHVDSSRSVGFNQSV